MTPGKVYADNPAALWAGVLIPPTAALLQLSVNYALLTWVCQSQQVWSLHLTTIVALTLTIFGGGLAYHQWQRAGGDWEDQGAGVIPRSRLMATIGMLGSGLFALVVVAQWIPIFLFGPCQR